MPDRRNECSNNTSITRVSVVVPTLNEEAELRETIARAQLVPEVCEIIVSDGGSTDSTAVIAASLGCRVVPSPRGRGPQMHAGAQFASGDIILLLHADTWLEPGAGRAIVEALQVQNGVGGGCYKVFRDPSWLMRGSRARCWLRFHALGRFMGDQAMFVRREVLERIGGVPQVPLMEELELGRRLRPHGRLVLADTVVSTSARRFRERGVLRTYARMWRVAAQYRLGTPAEDLQRIYEEK